jgi:NAD-dependent dihydropyrimidine dehydrogenase PreA subunit
MIFYFSGCGNSKHVAETIATGLNDSLIFIPEAARENRYEYNLTEDESLGFVFPIYAWGPPKLVLDFIEKLKVPEPVEGPTYIYFACTCGDECGLAEDIFRKALEQKGWTLNACFSVQMPETYIGMPGFKLDTDENAQRKIAAADKLMNDCILRLQNKESFSKMTKGGAAWFKSRLINPGFSKMATNDKKYYTTDACIHCGKCVEACPLKNVTLEDGHPKWNGNCTMCMSCYHHCPVNAIQYGKATVGKGQYYFGRR